jgi:flavorubredoxin
MAAREFGYMPNDRACVDRALDAVERCRPQRIAPMHGPVLVSGLDHLLEAFRSSDLAAVPH